MEQLLKLIEESVLKLVLVDAGDLQGLASLHTQFEQINQYADSLTNGGGDRDDQDQPGGSEAAQVPQVAEPDTAQIDSIMNEQLELIKSASSKATELLVKIIMEEIDDSLEAIQTVGETGKALQKLVEQLSKGQEPCEVVFPDQLGLGDVAGSVSAGDDNQPSPAGSGRGETESNFPVRIKLPENVDEEIYLEFITNQPHVLASLETAILTAEKEPTEDNFVAIKAILHNMKGEASLMGLEEIATVCHESESLLQESQERFPAEKLLSAKDWLQNTIGRLSGSAADEVPSEKKCVPDEGQSDRPPERQAEAEAAGESEQESLMIAEGDVTLVTDFISESSEHLESSEVGLLTIEENPEDAETINLIFRAFHTIKGVAGFLNLKQIGSLAHATENLLDLARKGEIILSGANIDVVFEANDVMKQMLASLQKAVEETQPIQPYRQLGSLVDRIKICATKEAPAPRLGNILVQDGIVSADKVRQSLHEQHTSSSDKKLGEILVENKTASEEQIDKALQKQQSGQEAKGKKVSTDSTVKVTTGRLDALINMVGELVIAQLMVSQDLGEHIRTNQRLARNARHLDKITRELQELSMSMRMVPVQGVFQKMARLVRDLSRKSGKEIEFIMSGAETELDRNMVEAIADPLVHMVRNSVDHGVETSEERLKAGKSSKGRLELRAFHQGGNIVIEISDDGKGLDREKILQKAISNGIVKEGQDLSDQEIYRLIFHAGLSTAEKITNISGRGVGMDVVRKNIESLRGRVDIDSAAGRGATFSIRLPLTLAVIDGQIISVGKEIFIIPTVSIEQSMRPEPEQISTVQGSSAEMIVVRGKLLPIVRLHRLFDITPKSTETCESLVVVVTDGDHRVCLQVDTLLGQQQVVIKSLGEYMGIIEGVSGAAIMGDGNVSLILDVPGLISLAGRK